MLLRKTSLKSNLDIFEICEKTNLHKKNKHSEPKFRQVFESNVYKPNHIAKYANFKKRKVKDRVKDEPDNVPAGLAIGLVEIFGGALSAIVPLPPFRWFSGILIGDGVRRINNSLEKTEEIKNHPKAPPGVPEPRFEKS